jgi:predicted RNase H-like HicB family nuclease
MQKPIITRAEEGGFIAVDPNTGTTTQGETYQEALRNLQETTSLYLETFPKKLTYV